MMPRSTTSRHRWGNLTAVHQWLAAFSSTQAYDTASKQVVFNLPVSSSVMAVDRLDQKLVF